MLSSLTTANRIHEALSFFSQHIKAFYRTTRSSIDPATFVILFGGLFKAGMIDEALKIYDEHSEKQKGGQFFGVVYSLLEALEKAGPSYYPAMLRILLREADAGLAHIACFAVVFRCMANGFAPQEDMLQAMSLLRARGLTPSLAMYIWFMQGLSKKKGALQTITELIAQIEAAGWKLNRMCYEPLLTSLHLHGKRDDAVALEQKLRQQFRKKAPSSAPKSTNDPAS